MYRVNSNYRNVFKTLEDPVSELIMAAFKTNDERRENMSSLLE